MTTIKTTLNERPATDTPFSPTADIAESNVQDAIQHLGGLLGGGIGVVDGDKGDITVSGSGATWTVDNNAITDAKLRDSAALSVIGRSANSTGDPADIAAASDGQVLRRSGTALGFGAVDLASANAITGTLPVANGGTGQTTEAEAVGELIQACTEDTAPDNAADYLATYDASADTGKKVLISTIAREKLTAARTYFVRTDGSNSNTGLANTSGGAFLTIQKAWDTLVALDLNGFNVTIKLGNTGTFTTGLRATVPPIGGNVTIEGDTATPTNTVVSTTSADAIQLRTVCTVTVDGLEVRTTTTGYGVAARVAGSTILIGNNNVQFGACASGHILARSGGIVTQVQANTPYAISGGAPTHYFASNGGVIEFNNPQLTLSGTPAFSSFFAYSSTGSVIDVFSMDILSGTATGTRYLADRNGVINSYSAGVSYFPGSVAGSTSSGGVYI